MFTSNSCTEPSASIPLSLQLVTGDHLPSLGAPSRVCEPMWEEVAGLKQGEVLYECSWGAEWWDVQWDGGQGVIS